MVAVGTRLIDTGEDEDVDYSDVGPDERWSLALNDDGDLRFSEEDNRLVTTADISAVTQSLKVALSTSKGDDHYDDEFGLDTFDATRSYGRLEYQIRKTLLYDDDEHSRVDQIIGYQAYKDHGNRHARVMVTVRLDTGEVTRLRFLWRGGR